MRQARGISCHIAVPRLGVEFAPPCTEESWKSDRVAPLYRTGTTRFLFVAPRVRTKYKQITSCFDFMQEW